MISKINQTIKLNLIGVIIFMLFGLVSNANESEGWIKRGSKPDDYEIGTIKDNERGKEVHFIKSIENKIKGFGTIMQCLVADKYLGRRVKLSGYIKTHDVEKWAGMWMRVDGKNEKISLSFDNMGKRPIKGTTKWTKYEIVLDVPDSSTNICYGVLVQGTGEAYLDDLVFEIVGENVKSTDMKYSLDGWLKLGGSPYSYDIGKINDSERKNKVYYLKSTETKIKSFGTIMQCIVADKYKGKRVRLIGYVKTKDIEQWAGMWMRVDGTKEHKVRSFDNMKGRPIKGTTNWTKYEIVLDVPKESTNICYGVLIYKTGQAWIDDFKFEVVDKTVPVTNMFKKKGKK